MSELKDTALVIASAVALKVVVQISADQLGRILHWCFVKTERDLIIWTHYQKHTLGQGHKPKGPIACRDENCKLI